MKLECAVHTNARKWRDVEDDKDKTPKFLIHLLYTNLSTLYTIKIIQVWKFVIRLFLHCLPMVYFPIFFFSFPYFFILLNFYVPHWLVLSYYNAKWWIWPCTQSRWWCGDCGYSAHSRPTGSFVPQHRRWPSAQQHTNAQFYSEYERTGNSSESSETKNTSGE